MDSQEGNNFNNESLRAHKKEAESFRLRQSLSKEAKELLIEASKDPHGTVIKSIKGYSGGITLQTNGKNLVKEDNPRLIALWELALKKLLNNNLLEEIAPIRKDYKGEVFKITDEGFKIADILVKRN